MSSRESEQMFIKMADLEKIWQHTTCKMTNIIFIFPSLSRVILIHQTIEIQHTRKHIISHTVFSYSDGFFSFSHSYMHCRSLTLSGHTLERKISHIVEKIGGVKLNWACIYGHIHLVNTSTPPCSNSH